MSGINKEVGNSNAIKAKVQKGYLEELHNYDPYIYSNTAKNWVIIIFSHIAFYAGFTLYFIMLWASIFSGNKLACFACFGVLFLIAFLYIVVGSIWLYYREKKILRNSQPPQEVVVHEDQI